MSKLRSPRPQRPLLVYSRRAEDVGTHGPTSDVQVVIPPKGALRNALDLSSAKVRHDRAPLADRRGAQPERPGDIRGALKVINNVLLEHARTFTKVKSATQPQLRGERLTSVHMDKLATISERLSDAMREAGVTASELARACTVSPAAVHKWQHGGKLSADNLSAAARSLGVREEWLPHWQAAARASARRRGARGRSRHRTPSGFARAAVSPCERDRSARQVPAHAWPQATSRQLSTPMKH